MSRNAGKLVLANVLGYILVIVVNGLANALPFNGLTTGEISDAYPNLFTPAGFTFGIWGVIYLFLGVFVIRQVGYYLRRKQLPVEVERIGGLFFFSCLMNASWIAAWHYLMIPLSFIIMLLLLASLVLIYMRLRGGRLAGRRAASSFDYWTLHVPFRIYLGWITAATLANLMILLVHRGFDAMSTMGALLASAMILTATIVAILMLAVKRDVIYSAVLLWTFTGILAQRLTASELSMPVIVTAFIGIVMILYGFLRVKLTAN